MKFKIFILVFFIFFSVTSVFIVDEVFSCFRQKGVEKEIIIPQEFSVDKIAKILKKEDIISSDILFKIYCRLKNYNNLKSGVFKLKRGLSYNNIVKILERCGSDYFEEKLTIYEGKSSFDIIDTYKNNLSIDIEEILRELNKLENISQFSFFNIIGKEKFESVYYKMEGFLLPYTFPLRKNSTAKSIAKDILKKCDIEITKLYKEAKDVGMNLWDVFTLASIIQGETSNFVEMPKISSVFHNRLKLNKRLEADATSKYVRRLPEYIKNKYDSYKVKGLPLGPICTPSFQAIKAAMYPLNTDLYFFYADSKTGKILYSKDFNGHKKNIYCR